jgi:hypothetical protein
MGSDNQERTMETSFRQQFNRSIGLYFYASGCVILGILAFCIYDDPKSLTKSYNSYNLAVMMGGALVCFGIGYTTGRKKK